MIYAPGTRGEQQSETVLIRMHLWKSSGGVRWKVLTGAKLLLCQSGWKTNWIMFGQTDTFHRLQFETASHSIQHLKIPHIIIHLFYHSIIQEYKLAVAGYTWRLWLNLSRYFFFTVTAAVSAALPPGYFISAAYQRRGHNFTQIYTSRMNTLCW